jgi:tetratricopeptide (TPR) repeat protein
MPRTLAVCFVIACALPLQPPIHAHAQTQPEPGANEVEGRSHFEAGRLAFSEGRYGAALEEFKRAYELTQRPALLYDIGTSADRLRRDQEALDAFDLYLVKEPNPDNLAEIQGRIAVLREAVTQHANAAVPVVTPEPTSTNEANVAKVPSGAPAAATAPPSTAVAARSVSSQSLAPWIVIAVSAGAALTGGVLVALALADISKVQGAPVGTKLSSLQKAHDRVPVLSTTGFVLLGIGGAGLAAGLAWKLLSADDEHEHAHKPTAVLRILPGGLDLSGSF